MAGLITVELRVRELSFDVNEGSRKCGRCLYVAGSARLFFTGTRRAAVTPKNLPTE